jgi:hypothetical protein
VLLRLDEERRRRREVDVTHDHQGETA